MKWYTFTYKDVWKVREEYPYNLKSEVLEDIKITFNDNRIKLNVIKIDNGYYEYIPSKNVDGKAIAIIREDMIDEYGYRERLDKYLNRNI